MSDIGVIAIGKNEGARLRRCLQSVVGKGWTVVYVDSNSTDGSVALAESMGCAVVQLDLSIPFSAARARNEGLARLVSIDGTAKYVQMVDGDCEIVDGWIERGVSALDAQPKLAVACGRRRERYPEASVYNTLADIEWDSPVGPAQSCGGDAMIRIAALQAVGGYDPSVVAGEEPEMCQRLRAAGWAIERVNQEMTLHDAAMLQFGQWWKRQVRSGYGVTDVSARFGQHGLFVGIARSARNWAIGYPAFVLGVAILSFVIFRPAAAGLVITLTIALLPLQMLRVAWKKRAYGAPAAIAYGVLTMVSKWAFYQGSRQYWNDRAAGKLARQIDYKSAPSPAATATQPVKGDPDWLADLARYPRRPFIKEQSIWAIWWYRFGRRCDRRSGGFAKWIGAKIYWPVHRVIETLTGVSLPKGATIGPGLRVYHFGNIFVHNKATLGANCTLRQGVTIGSRMENGLAPVLEDDVDCGAYAQILGEIRIGKGARIGAMSVVLKDVPAGATAVGIPARIIEAKPASGNTLPGEVPPADSPAH